MKQPGSTLVLRWFLENLRSTYLRWTRAYTHHPIITTSLSTLQRHLAIHRLRCTRRGRELHAPKHGSHSPARVPHAPGSSLLLQPLLLDCPTIRLFLHLRHSDNRLFGFLLFFRLYFRFCVFCIFLLFYVGFISLLFCLGYSVHLMLGLIFGVETAAPLWFYAVLILQLSFHSGSCFTRIGLFTEFLCNLYRLVRPWNRPGLQIGRAHV